MATFVKGAAIPHAVGYELYKDVSGTYSPVAYKTIGKNISWKSGYIADDGTYHADDQERVCTDMILIDDLVNNEQGWIAGEFNVGYTSGYSMSLYSRYNDYTSFIKGYTITDLGGIQNVTEESLKSESGWLYEEDAKYIVFTTLGNNADRAYYTLSNNILFILDKYAEALPAGQIHKLVVKTIGEGGVDLDGDGKIYSDSEYGGDANGEPLIYQKTTS